MAGYALPGIRRAPTLSVTIGGPEALELIRRLRAEGRIDDDQEREMLLWLLRRGLPLLPDRRRRSAARPALPPRVA